MAVQVEIYDLIEARARLIEIKDGIILTNIQGSIRFLGPVVIDYIFQALAAEFKIEKIIFRVDDDLAGLYYAKKKGYQHILYTGSSHQAKSLLADT